MANVETNWVAREGSGVGSTRLRSLARRRGGAALVLLIVSTTIAVRASAPADAAFIGGDSFGSSGLVSESSTNPTSLEFGPDDRLCVGQKNGSILAYNIVRKTAND